MLPGSRCKFCRVKFTSEERERGLKLHMQCISPFAESFAARQSRRKQAKAKQLKALEARELRKRKEAMKRLPELKQEAQREFNSYIRARDRAAGVPCVSCARNLDWQGNCVDAGHFRSVGSAQHLRFNERNCHAQCKHCNNHLGGNHVNYRIGLIQRIGLEAVEALESDNSVHKWTREELIELKATYRRKLKELRNAD